jgi:hypothetical protein
MSEMDIVFIGGRSGVDVWQQCNSRFRSLVFYFWKDLRALHLDNLRAVEDSGKFVY